MKAKAMFLAVMAGAALPVLAQADQTNTLASAPGNTRISTVLVSHRLHFSTPFSHSLPTVNDRVNRVNGISSRPWADAVGPNTGVPQWRLEDGEFNEGGLTLIWWGHEPGR